MISVLVAARPDSPFLQNFTDSYFAHTHDLSQVELCLLYSAADRLNTGLIARLAQTPQVTVMPEAFGLGRRGHHVYFNTLAAHARGDWLLLLCEDMEFITGAWDSRLGDLLAGRDPGHVWGARPHCKPADHAMVHVLSRGFLLAAGNVAECSQVDSWVNHLFAETCPTRLLDCPDVWFHDYSHDPSGWARFTDGKTFTSVTDAAKVAEMPDWGEARTYQRFAEVQKKVQLFMAGQGDY